MNQYGQMDPVIADISAGYLVEYTTIGVPERWVSDGLKKELETWDYSMQGALGPVLINAPTGSGKSTFVMKDLAERVRHFGKYVLLLSNRSVLSLQQKYDASHYAGGVQWSGESLSGLNVIGNVLVFTYQSICRFLDNPNFKDRFPIGAVVFDEAHFFASDATFNPYTAQILQMVVNCCWGCQRIYMTATPEDVRWIIAYEEYKLRANLNFCSNTVRFLASKRNRDFTIREYVFPADYSHIRLHFWNDWSDVEQMIRDDKSEDKWVLFVEDATSGKALKKRLGKDAEYMDASVKQANMQRFTDLARRESFEKKILVTTTVLDNGVNFKDPALKHVVIESMDPVQVKQMLGRKRVEKDETVQVHIIRKKKDEVDASRRVLKDLYRLLEECHGNPYYAIKSRWESLTESQRRMITLTPNGFVPSGYAAFQLDRMMARLERLSDRMMGDGEGAFIQEVCSWFGPTLRVEEATIGESLIEKIKPVVQDIFEKYLQKSPLEAAAHEELQEELRVAVHPLGKRGPTFKTDRINANIVNVAKYFALPYDSKKARNQWHITSTLAAQDEHDNKG